MLETEITREHDITHYLFSRMSGVIRGARRCLNAIAAFVWSMVLRIMHFRGVLYRCQ